MRICLVTTFPPSHGGLSEYGLHIARELHRNPFINLTILADKIDSDQSELPDFKVVRCWSPDRPASIIRLLAQIRRSKPDVVWFNLLFSTFGNNPLNAFAGLMIPPVTRLSGRYTHVTLHHLMDTVDLSDLGVRFVGSYRMAGAIATRMLLLSSSVSVLMPRYREILSEKYGGENVHVRSHGILTHRPQPPNFSRRGNPVHRILAFGKWGTYKRLELMIEAFGMICEQLPNVELVIAGGDHPNATGYVESVRGQCGANGKIEFTGYVDEDRLADVFQSSSVAVMPYTSSTGCSGVAHLACAYSVPIVCANLPDFQQMASGEDLAVEFHRPGDARDLADCLVSLLQNSEKLQVMAFQNFSAALRMTMPSIIQKYLRHFQLQQQIETLRQVAKFRKLPNWLPSKNLLLRGVTRTWKRWVDHSVIFRPGRDGESSFNNHRNGRGQIAGTGTPIDGNRITGRGGARSTRPAPTGSQGQTESDRAQNPNGTGRASDDSAFSLPVSCVSEPGDPERKHPQREGKLSAFESQTGAGHRNGGNGKSGGGLTGGGSDGCRQESASQDAGEVGAREGDWTIQRSGFGRRDNRETP